MWRDHRLASEAATTAPCSAARVIRAADLSPQERHDVEVWMALEEQDARDHPLAWATLWHRNSPRTSQRRAARTLTSPGALYAFLLGGNRSGKSETAAQLAVVWAQGRDHPDSIRWAHENKVDISEIPLGPGPVWYVNLDSQDSRRYGRPKVATYLPKGSKWRNRDGTGEAEVKLPDGGKITFKSSDQGRDGFQGDAVRVVIFDEEPPSAVVRECLMRIADMKGRLIFAMTPLNGWTDLLEEHLREQASDVVIDWLDGTDNPHVDPVFLEQLYRKYGPHEKEARKRGRITALEGRVHELWDRAIHVIGLQANPEKGIPEVPDDWFKFRSIDFGTRNPTSVGWYALDPRTDVLHRYRWHYGAGRSTEWHCRRTIKLSEPDCPIEYEVDNAGRVMLDDAGAPVPMLDEDDKPIREDGYDYSLADPAGTAERMTWSRMGIRTLPAYKGPGSVRAGISACSERLALDADGNPGFVVHDPNDPFNREIESYVWDTTNRKGDNADAPLKKNDHAMDEWRYLCHHLSRTR